MLKELVADSRLPQLSDKVIDRLHIVPDLPRVVALDIAWVYLFTMLIPVDLPFALILLICVDPSPLVILWTRR